MSNRYLTEDENIKPFPLLRDIVLLFIILISAIMWGCPQYRVWQQGLVGKASLKRAEQDRQIVIEEAHAKKESSVLLAEAEVARARGVAEANTIVAEGLGGPEGYLRYLWIQALQDKGNEVIYVPTEANIPIMEAGRTVEK